MLDITAGNTARLPTTAGPRAPRSYPKRYNAQRAAIATIGPHAREGFEFTSSKVDGLWYWRACDEVRPDTPDQVKANGGKRAAQAPGKAAGAIEAPTLAQLAPEPRKPADALPTAISGGYEALKAAGGLRSEPIPAPKTIKDAIAAAMDRGLTPKQFVAIAEKAADDFALPPFLLREKETPEQAAARRAKFDKLLGPDRKIKNPPDAKPAVAKAKRAIGKNIGWVARDAILHGKTNDEALAAVMAAFPKCNSNKGCMGWYRNKLRNDGLLNKDGSASAKGEAWLKKTP